jgi:hypothetical protein
MRPDRVYCADVARRVQGIVQETLDKETSRHPLARLSSFVAGVRQFSAKGPSDAAAELDPLLGDPRVDGASVG